VTPWTKPGSLVDEELRDVLRRGGEMNTLYDGLSRTLGAVGKKVVGLEDNGTVLKVQARSTVRSAPCPACRRCSNRIHGTYFRRLAERPSLEQQVVLEIEMRRFKFTVKVIESVGTFHFGLVARQFDD